MIGPPKAPPTTILPPTRSMNVSLGAESGRGLKRQFSDSCYALSGEVASEAEIPRQLNESAFSTIGRPVQQRLGKLRRIHKIMMTDEY
jgi:hypothetical protein